MKKPGQLTFEKVGGWGGKRRGAGRPNQSGQASHGKRPLVSGSTPLHITWRLKQTSVNLRCSEIFEVFKKSALRAKKFGIRVVHYSIQGNHLHMMIEASDNSSLSCGLKSFGICFAKGVRQVVKITGPLFAGRYHMHILKTPTEVKRTLIYILQNFSKHSKLIWHLDKFSSAPYFESWHALLNGNPGPLLHESDGRKTIPFYLSAPRSWLAREGWRRSQT